VGGAVGGLVIAKPVLGNPVFYSPAGATLLGGAFYVLFKGQFDTWTAEALKQWEAREHARLSEQITRNLQILLKRNGVNTPIDLDLLADNLRALSAEEIFYLDALLTEALTLKTTHKTVTNQIAATTVLTAIAQKAKYIFELIQ
jgi:hypothetical protein